jgi:preprotein translocase subunit SecD
MMVDVIPVSDPNNSTMAQRVVQYQTVLQMSSQAPQIYDLPQLHRQMIEVLGVKNADKLVPTKDDAKPTDPISENMDALVGKPVKAFIYQDHEAHIATHTSFMQDPMMAQMIGQNPQAKQIMASLQAHIAEHLGFAYRTKIEEKLGVPLPAPNEEMDEDMEVQLSRLVADAGKQLTQANQKQAAQQKAQQQQQDPIIQMKQAELQIKQAEEQRKAQKDQADSALQQEKLKLQKAKDLTSAMLDAERVKIDQAELTIEAEEKGIKLEQAGRAERNKIGLETACMMRSAQTPKKES